MSNLFSDDDIIYDDEGGTSEDFYDGGGETDFIEPEGLPEARLNPLCLGHQIEENLFLEMFKKNTLPHAMIFSGPDGIGKTTMAFRLARFLLKHGTQDDQQDALFGAEEIEADYNALAIAEDDPVFRKVGAGGHPNLLHITRKDDTGKAGSNLKVDVIRKIEPFLRKTAADGGWRIVIVEDADTMNNAAQNAILKILEEPPAKVIIILIAHRIGKLITTIRSRARVVQFRALDSDVMAELLKKKNFHFSVMQMSQLHALSQGSIGRALYYAEEDGLGMLDKILYFLGCYPEWNWRDVHDLSSSLSGAAHEKSYRIFTEQLQWVFRQLLFIKARGGNDLPDYLQNRALEKILRQSSLQRLVRICDDLQDHFQRVDFSNLDRRDAVRSSFLVISQ